VDLFPDEVIFLLQKYGAQLPVRILEKRGSFTGFILQECSDGKNCKLQNDRPIFCRCYPVRPYFLSSGGYKIDIHEKCPQCAKRDEKFFHGAVRAWREALSWTNRAWWKRWRARKLLAPK
jgi:hypothetical protein